MGHTAIAKGRYIRISPQKSRLVADLVRGKDAGEALTILNFSRRKKAAGHISKVLNSAIANAQVKYPNLDVDNLYISRIFVDQAPALKRFRPAPRGRGVRILKHYAHITVCLDEREEK
ncbi:MAG: 50S ribosomal protein L22 [Acidobacteriota bacterium]|jgi:large subunit ribosomal protein L22|nr:50S ribosomal protein L22 [Acidobacteriota bacterium]